MKPEKSAVHLPPPSMLDHERTEGETRSPQVCALRAPDCPAPSRWKQLRVTTRPHELHSCLQLTLIRHMGATTSSPDVRGWRLVVSGCRRKAITLNTANATLDQMALQISDALCPSLRFLVRR